MITLYGIKNCDTMKKARAWLDAQGLSYQFHDYKKDGIGAEQLQQWEAELGWEVLLNRRGTTWRALDAATQSGINRERALALMQAQPSLIKRPLLQQGGLLLIGFDAAQWTTALRT